MSAGQNYQQNQSGGSTEHNHNVVILPHTLTKQEMPSHSHSVPGAWTQYWTNGIKDNIGYGPKEMDTNHHSYFIGFGPNPTGGNQPHDHDGQCDMASNIPPYFAVCFIMKL